MEIYKILEELNLENGTNYKLSVLKKYSDNDTLKRVFQMALDKVKFTYGITMKNVDVPEKYCASEDLEWALDMLEAKFVSREKTGHAAKEELEYILSELNEDDSIIIQQILGRDLKVNLGRTQVNKIWKDAVVKPPYMRCGIYGEKTAKKINFPAFVQLKADGMFQAVTVEDGKVTFMSRAGEERLLPHIEPLFSNMTDGVYIGELLVRGIDDRALANGLINSDDPKDDVYMQLWDYVSLSEYSDGKHKDKSIKRTRYIDRLEELTNNLGSLAVADDSPIQIVPYKVVETIQEALAVTSEWMQNGFEGSILKDFGNEFKDTTSPTQLKLKLEIDLEVRCTGFTEGKAGTKRELTFGAMTFETDDGLIKGQTSGFNDKELADFNSRREELIGKVFTVQCNDLTQARGNEYYALSHPRFIEFRNDKDTTDDLTRALDLKNMAMMLG